MTDFEECLLVPYGASAPSAERLMLLAPHPDDEVLGCGGLAALTIRAGGTVHPFILTDGGAGNFSGFASAADYVRIRRNESLRAAEILGTNAPEFFDFPDRSLPGRFAELEARLAAAVVRLAPTLLVAPSPAETHPDHRAAARAAFTIFSASRSPEFARLLFYEVSAALAPNVLYDIDQVSRLKEQAIACFESQNREKPFAELIGGLNRYRSMTLPHPARFAEAFFSITRDELGTTNWETFKRRIGPERPEAGR